MSRYEIQRMLVLSTAHIPVEERKLLDSVAQKADRGMFVGLIVDPIRQYGWRVHVPDRIGRSAKLQVTFSLLKVAKEQDCQWLALDCDGPVVPSLKTYED